MAAKTSGGAVGGAHEFGGGWTDAKLSVVGKYLAAYNIALKRQPFKRVYIDAFAGTGYRTPSGDHGDDVNAMLFPDLAEDEPQALLDGSARIALKTSPSFDQYVFIERSAQRCAELEKLKDQFPHLATSIDVRKAEANSELQSLCAENWIKNKKRAVLFLDPYGMQVEWDTIAAAAATKAMDVWILFPLGMGMSRVLVNSGRIRDSWRRRINALLGTEDWFDEFYKTSPVLTLFGDEEVTLEKASMEVIGKYFNRRLESVFAGVAPNPGFLRRGTNPLYMLCFATGNPAAVRPAINIAKDLLKGLASSKE